MSQRWSHLVAGIVSAGFIILLGTILACEGSAWAQNEGFNTLSPAESAEGWTLLFDGKTLNGWQPVGNAEWRVENGMIVTDAVAERPSFPAVRGFLKNSRTFSNFELKADFWFDRTANSGIFLRCPPGGNPSANDCYEINIFDLPPPAFPTGSIVFIKSTVTDYAAKWNSYDITANGTHLTVKLNGTITAETDDNKHASGIIALQSGGSGTIRFRNIKIRSLGGGEAGQ